MDWKLVVFFVLGAAIGTSSPAFAQDAQGALEQTMAASPEERATFAAEALVEMAAAEKRVERMLEEAQRDKDDLRVACLTKRLASIRATAEVATQGKLLMERYQAEGTADAEVLAAREFRKIAVGSAKVREYLAEAEACVGDAGTADGDTTVELLTEGGDDDEAPPPLEERGPEPDEEPPAASPFQ